MLEPRRAGRARRSLLVEQEFPALSAPRALVGERELIEGLRLTSSVIDPDAQEIAAAQQVDREAVVLVLVRKLAPERILRLERSQRLNMSACKRHGRNAACE